MPKHRDGEELNIEQFLTNEKVKSRKRTIPNCREGGKIAVPSHKEGEKWEKSSF